MRRSVYHQTASESTVLGGVALSLLHAVERCPIVAVLRFPGDADLSRVALAVARAGVAAVEFSLDSPLAITSLVRAKRHLGGRVSLGIGTVTTANQAIQAIEAGADFLMTPVLSRHVLEVCAEHATPCVAGALTPTEIWQAAELGAMAIKGFPASRMGHRYIADILAPLSGLRLMPTGGVDEINGPAFLKAGAWALGVGSRLVSPSLVGQSRWRDISQDALEFVKAVRP